jgi:hypothetical protein
MRLPLFSPCYALESSLVIHTDSSEHPLTGASTIAECSLVNDVPEILPLTCMLPYQVDRLRQFEYDSMADKYYFVYLATQ